MKTILLVIPFITGIAALSGFKKQLPISPITIQGKVVSGLTNKPVPQAYIYITTGEEEAITDKDGNFTIKTWQSLPITCTVEHKNYIKKKLSITDNNKLQVVLQEKEP